MLGRVAEWLCRGLQILVYRFDSVPGLHIFQKFWGFVPMSLSLISAIPFILTLLSFALGPVLLPRKWHIFENKSLVLCGFLGIFSIMHAFGLIHGIEQCLHVILQEYTPFLIILIALFVVSSGIKIQIDRPVTPTYNTLLLLVGALLANFIGTTGTSMLLIRPFLHLNRTRKSFSHGVVFFIFIISNSAGCLTPIGDPPLFLGYLHGVDFFWPLKNLFPAFLGVMGCLLCLFFLFDSYFIRQEQASYESKNVFKIQGKHHFLFFTAIVAALVGFGSWHQAPIICQISGINIQLNAVLRDISLLGITFLSLKTMHPKIKEAQLKWAPIWEVGKLFLVIFITLIPISLMLKMGSSGPFSGFLKIVDSHNPPFAYFWLSGLFSSFLDNAPTYLVFFKMAGGDAHVLQHQDTSILMAISLGAVLMGAMTYIGNAPNMMVKNMARHYHVQTPSFFGYMLWSVCILIPLFIGISLWLF